MIVIKTCKCGSNDFYQEDDGTWRCQDCERLADFGWIKDPEKEEENEGN